MGLGLRFLLASLYRDRYRELVADLPIFGERPPEPFTVECPTCGALYLADKTTYDEPYDLDGLEWEALTRLADECPDHPHAFAVGP